ncbi:HIT domain-containing protein [Glaciibacter psychrotolerans]|uniref:Histidine triad (HIT) family protein n=1 Tax=Glaciibacter psychrotolerans TaxID=670054 RepID=A0A7Z0ECA1_9MICO|nr:HIT domain-containing protein [Leifsonia psychrotolerans]NYJ18868.1 histidine triad (HIT) family protein [Leifsonia psychrotolerans]
MTSSGAEPSIFSRIVAREIPATIVAENDQIIAFEDINPQAPVHIVVTTKTGEYRDVVELAAGDPLLLAELVRVAHEIAAERTGGEFRLVFNTGAAAGQTVFHVHAHVLGGGLGEGTLGSR